MVRTLAVIPSPLRPSPRVAAWTRTPSLVDQLDREAVELRLEHVLDGEVRPQPLAQALVETAEGGLVLVRIERQHGRRVLDGGEAVDRLAGDPLGGGVLGDEVRMRRLQRLQLVEEPVELRVGDRRRVFDVVEVLVVADLGAQFRDLLRGLLAGHRRWCLSSKRSEENSSMRPSLGPPRPAGSLRREKLKKLEPAGTPAVPGGWPALSSLHGHPTRASSGPAPACSWKELGVAALAAGLRGRVAGAVRGAGVLLPVLGLPAAAVHDHPARLPGGGEPAAAGEPVPLRGAGVAEPRRDGAPQPDPDRDPQRPHRGSSSTCRWRWPSGWPRTGCWRCRGR